MNTLPRLACLLTSLVLAVAARAEDRTTLRTLNGEVPAGIRAIEADNHSGNVTVTAVGDRFGWEWNLRTSRGRSSRAEAYAEECRLDIRESNGVLQFVVVRPDRDRDGRSNTSRSLRRFLSVATLGVVSTNDEQVESDLTLRVPATSKIDVKNRFGSVHVTGPRSPVTVDCQNGRVELADIAATVTARATFGALRAQRIGSAQLTTQNGPLEARDVTGDLRASASFAKLQAHDVKGDASLKNQNGPIAAARITGNLIASTSFSDLRAEQIGGKAELKNQNGRVDAIGVTGEVTATNSFGTLRAHDVGRTAVLKNQNGIIEALRVTGDLTAKTSFADLRVEEVGGKADLECNNGKIEATRITGNLRAVNSFGALRVRDISGSAELEGQNGDIAAAGVTGDIRARNSFGRLKLEGNSRRFDARNQNGAVEIIAHSPSVERIDASASFAPIDVRLPGDAKPFIRATTSFGKVHSDFPVLQGDTVSDAKFAAETAPLKISLKGQNGDIRIQQIAAR